jgi:signal transduction histidine kinase
MDPDPVDPRWPRLLSLAVHEFRTPMTVVSGYVRMLLQERAGALTDPQRRLLQEAEKSCARLSALLAEVSELSNLESGKASFNRGPLDLRPVLEEAAAGLPDLPDREVRIALDQEDAPAPLDGDAVRLRTALASVIVALRRELVTSTVLHVRQRRDSDTYRISLGDEARIDALAGGSAALTTFDEWRGGCGMSLAIARRVLEAHGGRIWSPAEDGRAGAVISLPAAAR